MCECNTILSAYTLYGQNSIALVHQFRLIFLQTVKLEDNYCLEGLLTITVFTTYIHTFYSANDKTCLWLYTTNSTKADRINK